MRSRFLFFTMLAILLLTSRAYACVTRRLRKDLVDTKDFVWNGQKTDLSSNECEPCSFYNGYCVPSQMCQERGMQNVRKWVFFFLIVLLAVGTIIYLIIDGIVCDGKRDDPYKYPNCWQYGGRGGRDWPYHKDPALARNKEDISEAGDEIDTSAFGV